MTQSSRSGGTLPKVRAALRKQAQSSPRVQRAVRRLGHELESRERLAPVYERLRTRFAGLAGLPGGGPAAATRPADPKAAKAAQAAQAQASAATLVRTLTTSGDLDLAAVRTVRDLFGHRQAAQARSLAHALVAHPGTRDAGNLCRAVLATADNLPEIAWDLFGRIERATAARLALPEYVRVAFVVDPAAASAVLADVRAGTLTAQLQPMQWLSVARLCFAGGDEEHSAWALRQVEATLTEIAAPRQRRNVVAEIAWMRTWYGRAAAAQEPVGVPAGEIPFAVIDYKQPSTAVSSVNIGDPVQTLASLGHVARRSRVTFAGDDELVTMMKTLQGRVKPDRRLDNPTDEAVLRLYAVDRDATNYCSVPDGTWMLAFGWYQHPIFGQRYDFPFNERLRPIFVSFHVNAAALLTEDAVAYLRRYEPIGCRDWSTVHLLKAAGVSAFFSGCITTTIDTVFPPDPAARPTGTLFVDTPVQGAGEWAGQASDAVKRRSIAANVDEAIERVQGYRDTYERVVTSRLHCYLPSRSIGADAEFKPKNPADPRFWGLAGIDDTQFDRIRTGILDKLDAVLGAILAGRSEDEVYAVWREVCADDVAAADATVAAIKPIEPPGFDVAAACDLIRSSATTVERSQPGPDAPEINVEFSLDGNLKHEMGVVLDSIVTHASRPIRLHVLCRDHGPADFARMAQLFPTVSFVWLPTDRVDYGRITGMIAHITVATMDRLLLPELLPEVDRILHHDLDALCLADVAELHDTELGGAPLAARDQMHPNRGSGYVSLMHAARRMRGRVQRSRELVLRTHARLPFDFRTLNAGIMVLDLARMRADGFCRNFLPYAERFGMNDQEILNVYAGADRARFDRRWNAFPRLEPIDDAKIIHWLGPMKPWRELYVDGRNLWREYEARFDARAAAAPQ